MNPMLAGKRVMIVEDEKILAAVLEDALQLSGATPPTVCFDPERALSVLASQNFDAAILDVSLGRRDSYAVADELRHRQIPFAFATASHHLPEAYQDVPHLRKPYDYEELLRCVAGLCATQLAVAKQG